MGRFRAFALRWIAPVLCLAMISAAGCAGTSWAATPGSAAGNGANADAGASSDDRDASNSAAIVNYFTWRRNAFAHLLTVGSRISAAAGPECPGVAANPGFAIEQAEQYAPEIRPLLGFAPGDMRPRILAVGPGTAAAAAGLAAGDILALWPADQSQTRRDHAFDGVDNAITAIETRLTKTAPVSGAAPPYGAPPVMILPVVHGEQVISVIVNSGPGCGGWFDVQRSDAINAASTERWIQPTDSLLNKLVNDDAGLAFLIGHEMGHRVMRLDARRNGTPAERRGKWSDCGERCEENADRLGMTFAIRAGYDPWSGLSFMRHTAAARGVMGWLDGTREVLSARIACLDRSLSWLQKNDKRAAVKAGDMQVPDCDALPAASSAAPSLGAPRSR